MVCKVKPVFIMCNCTGECPGFKDMNFWKLLNYGRNELNMAYAIIHPQFCVDDGERFFKNILQQDGKFEKKGLSFDELVIPLDLRNMTTEQAMEKVRETVKALNQSQ